MNAPAFRLIRWLARRFGAETLLQWSLLWLALGVIMAGLARMVPAVRQAGAFWILLLGVGTGCLLARGRWRGWLAAPAAMLIGALGLLLTTGRLAKPTGAVLLALMTVLRQGKEGLPLLSERWGDFLDHLATLMSRFALWFQVARSGNVILDPLVTALLWGMGLWLMTVWAAWWMQRRSAALTALLPALAVLAFVGYYTGTRDAYLYLALAGGALVLLQGLGGYRQALQRWVRARLDRADIEGELAFAVVGLAVLLMTTGGLLPSISLREIAERIQDMLEARRNEELARSLGLEQTPVAAGARRSGGTMRTETLLIQGAPQLSQTVILYVQVAGYQPLPPAARLYGHVRDTAPRYYWRAQTFERYNGRGWTSLYATEEAFAAGESLWPQEGATPPGLQRTYQTVERLTGDDVLVFAGTLVSVNQPYHVWWRAAGDMVEAHSEAQRYEVTTLLPDVTVAQLRQAGTEYPPGIVTRYLQLPENLPSRVRDVALDLTALQPTPYDKAVAIETYLRGFPYDETAPAPPPNRDAVDYFLFDLQRGYCNYYATAMVVLARAAGLPARLVTGYSSGIFDEASHRFVVVAANAHAWAEIYFPGIGWVEFEPTAALAPIERPLGEASLASSVPVPQPMERGGSPQAILRRVWLARLRRYSGWLALGVLALVGLYRLLAYGWLYLLPPSQTLRVLYRRLYRLGQRFGIRLTAGGTPHEFAARLSARLRPSWPFAPLQAAFEADLHRLTELYARVLYAPRPLNRREQRAAVHLWLRLRHRLRALRRA